MEEREIREGDLGFDPGVIGRTLVASAFPTDSRGFDMLIGATWVAHMLACAVVGYPKGEPKTHQEEAAFHEYMGGIATAMAGHVLTVAVQRGINPGTLLTAMGGQVHDDAAKVARDLLTNLGDI